MKKTIAIILVLCLALSLAACSTQAPAAASSSAPAASQAASSAAPASESASAVAASEKKTITIDYAFLMQDEMMTNIWKEIQANCEAYNKANPDTKVAVNMLNADSKVDKEMSNIESFIVKKPDAIIINAVDANGSIPAVQAVKKAGIPVADALHTIASKDSDLQIIGMDHYLCGKLQAERLEKYLQDNPSVNLKIGYLDGDPAATDALQRYTGFKENFLDKHKSDGRATEVAHAAGMFKADVAMSTVEDWYQSHPDMNCLVTASDVMSIGGIQVAVAKQKNLLTLGIDGSGDALRNIKEGKMLMTVLSDFKAVSKGIFDESLKLATHKQTEKQINLGTTTLLAVDSSNVDKYYTVK